MKAINKIGLIISLMALILFSGCSEQKTEEGSCFDDCDSAFGCWDMKEYGKEANNDRHDKCKLSCFNYCYDKSPVKIEFIGNITNESFIMNFSEVFEITK